VNGRYIKSFQLFNAVQAAYHTRLPINRYPVCVINIELDPSLVDVNVHPTKLEVRFSEERDVFAAVQNAVQTSLDKETFIPKAYPSTPKSFAEGVSKEKSKQPELQLGNPVRVRYSAPQSAAAPYPQPRERVRESTERGSQVLEKASMEAAMELYRPSTGPSFPVVPTRVSPGEEQPAQNTQHEQTPSKADDIGAQSAVDDLQVSGREDRMPRFRPVAQALGMYVIAEDEQGLYIIDQHAAHEKVLYERFSKQLADKEIGPLPLLVPLTLELSAAEGEKLKKHFSVLAEYHLDIDSFGGSSFLIRSVPDIWGGLDVQRLTSEFIDELLSEAQVKDPRALIEDKIIMKSCKSAIKANQWLSMPEMTALCDQLSELENPFHCPHGRPIIIHMTRYDLEKQFKRVM
jgi:DNA mismatch repair protein MutL